MKNPWNSFGLGVLRVSPLMLGVIPFGMICGANAVEAGLTPVEAVLMSVVVFAGASQLAVTQLMASDASWWVILLTGTVINMRMLMYSASLSRYLGHESAVAKVGVAYLLTDQAWATSLNEYHRDREGMLHQCMFYLGVAGLMWLSFLISTGIGAFLGSVVPRDWDLGFSVPLTFLALLMNALREPRYRRSALIAGTIATLMHILPFNLGMLLGAAAGIAGGHLLSVERRAL
jgi:predicted branched-subunit amino acid permease